VRRDMSNLHHPGRPEYAGPPSGIAGYVYHNERIAYCWSYDDRLHVIDAEKPKRERAIRRACLTHLAEAPVEIIEAGRRLEKAERRLREALRQYKEKEARVEYGRDGGAWRRYWKATQQANGAYWSLLDAVQAYLTPARKAKLLALLKRLTPDAPWNRKQLVFPRGKARTSHLG